MTVQKFAAIALLASAWVGASAPVQAVTTAFANFSTLQSSPNIFFKNGNSANTSTSGTIFTISAGNSTIPGPTDVVFNFLIGGLPQAVKAKFTLFGATNSAVQQVGACPGPTCFLIQPNITGSFSFTANGNQTIGSYTIPDGTNLLSATNYTGALIAGVRGGNAAGFTGTDPAGGTITYTSDPMFGLDFSTTMVRDFSITIGSISQPSGTQVGFNAKAYNTVPTAALTTFRASANGTFGSEPSPSVPEPATWALFVAGFGMVGLQVRRRRHQPAAF